jgi:hypothetical protein
MNPWAIPTVMADGGGGNPPIVEIYVHGSSWHGHAAINVNGTVYDFDRYDSVSDDYKSGTGPGILIVWDEKDYLNYRSGIDSWMSSYQINSSAQQPQVIVNHFDNLIGDLVGELRPSGGTAYHIGTYNVLTNNCTTVVLGSLSNAPYKWYINPSHPYALEKILRIWSAIDRSVERR